VPEWFAYRHYSQFIQQGARIVAFRPTGQERVPVLMAVTEKGKHIIVAGNLSDATANVSVKIGSKYLNIALQPHSFNTFVEK
jgi:glucosylceramidase